MNINSQHHNLLGNQISPKIGGFLCLAGILYLGYHGNGRHFEFVQPQKLPHTMVDIPTNWIIIWLPNYGYQFPTSKSTWKPNFAQIGGFLYLVAILYLCYHRSPQTTPISEFGHVDASFIITNQFLTSKYSYISIFIEIGDH
jgi:hypothetical protein